jgi:hypothetical protein
MLKTVLSNLKMIVNITFNRNPIMTSDTSIISDNDNYLVEIEIDTHPTPLERDKIFYIRIS